MRTESMRELSENELNAVSGGATHGVTGKEFKGGENAYSPGAWADPDSSVRGNHPFPKQ